MRISIDLVSVHDTSRVLAAAADEYDRAAAALQRGDGLAGVTGPQRYWLTSATESVAARLRTVAAQHRETAADLTRRCECASANGISPVYAGLAVAGAQIAFDRTGDGINDTIAIDQDGDGFFETFTLDAQQDGVYDTILVTDVTGNLAAAGFDRDQDGHMEEFVGVTTSGPLLGTDADRDGTYAFAPLNPPVTTVQPGALLGPSIVGGYSITDGIESGSSGMAVIGGNAWSTGITSFSLGPSIVGGVIHPENGPLGGLFGGVGAPGRAGGIPDVDGNGITPWFDDPGTRQPELGRYDTYNWMNDPRLDSDKDGIFNNADNNVRRYDPPERD
jgi:hypothetical protein